MFACGMYPSDEDFLRNVNNEVRFQVSRLKNHPSIVLWCGNNEVLEGYLTWGWKNQLKKNSEDAYRSYLKLFHELIPEVLEEIDPTRPYWPSSPYPGKPGPPELTKGDFHFWDLVKEIKPYTVYSENVGRFMSEYGFKSYPELRTIEAFLETKDWNIHSPAMEEHQGWETGAELVEKNIEWFYPAPSNFQEFLYLSQLLQADAIGFAIENHRKSKPRCSGTLYWQLNDCWPSATWSSVDYFGRWKALHYKLKTVFKDVLLSAVQEDGYLRIYAISDLPEEKEFRLGLKIIDFHGKVIAEHNSIEILCTDKSTVIYEQKLDEFITEDEKKK
jgi:beta-mannosidase